MTPAENGFIITYDLYEEKPSDPYSGSYQGEKTHLFTDDQAEEAFDKFLELRDKCDADKSIG
jgi:hypothetical protein